MQVFEMIVFVVLISVCAGVVKQWLSLKTNQESNQETQEDQQARVDDLEARVKVLEAIVTDKKFSLNQEFDALKREAS